MSDICEFNIPNRCNWDFRLSLGDYNPYKCKRDIVASYISNMVRRVSQMFEWKNLPDTIPEFELERMLQLNGYAVIADVPEPVRGEKGLYAFYAILGGRGDAYYKPTTCSIANPYLGFNKTGIEINKDCALILNDLNYEGLYTLYSRYAHLLAEIDITMRVLSINSRAPFVLYCKTDDMKITLDDYIAKLEAGEISYIMGGKFRIVQDDTPPNIETKPYATQSAGELIKSLIELKQYVKASFFAELGIQDNFNMKREALSVEEINLGDDTLMPYIDEMLFQRQRCAEIVNNLYGTEISVDFSSVWKERRRENELMEEKLEAEVMQVEQASEHTEDSSTEEEVKEDEN